MTRPRGIWSEGEPDLITSRQINTNDGVITCRSSLKIFAEAAAEYTPERVMEATGIGEKQLERAAEIISECFRRLLCVERGKPKYHCISN